MSRDARPGPTEPLFLERQTYRRRRLMDAARLLPVAGAVLFLFPMLWAGPEAAPDARTAAGGLFIFAVWTLLILAAALLSRHLVDSAPPSDDGRAAPPPPSGTGPDPKC